MQQISLVNQEKYEQYLTPSWAAELLVERYFGDLGDGDTVLEPSCGDGRFLMAVPGNVDAYGVEIDPVLAELARSNSGREVICDDFMYAKLPRSPSAVIGNPPFSAESVDGILNRCFEEMDYGGRIGFILPASIFQTASRVVRYQSRWSMAQDVIPRNMFERLQSPLVFARFTKDMKPVSVGFFLHAETNSITQMRQEMRKLMMGNQSTANCWRDVVHAGLKALGGKATLPELYQVIENNRPTENPWWKEKIRQVAGKHFVRVEPGVYQLA